MDYKTQQLKLFLSALKNANFNPKFLDFLPRSTKDYCLNLLRAQQQFQGEEFKNDTRLINGLSSYLRDPVKVRPFLATLGIFTEQQKEFAEILEKPTAGVVSEQALQEETVSGQAASAQQSTAARQPVAAGGGQPLSSPRFSIPRAPRISTTPASTPKVQELSKTPVPDAFTKAFENEPAYKLDPTKKVPEKPSITGTGARPALSFQTPKLPSSFINSAKNVGSAAGRFFQRNVGKFLTLERGVTGFTTVLGGIVGKGLGGNPGMFAGAVTGGITPSFIKSGGGKFLGRVGGKVVDFGHGLSNEISSGGSRLKNKGIPKKFWLLLIGMFLFVGLTAALTGSSPVTPPGGGTQNQVNITKTGPDQVAIDQEIPYTITVIYTGGGTANITVNDTLDKQTSFKSASDNGTNQGETVTWIISNLHANTPKLLQLSVTPNVPQGSLGIWVVNSAQATVTSTSGGSQTANNNDCGGKYKNSINNPLGNFGDPSCSYTEKLAYQRLQQLDPTNADYWYNTVIPCESSYSPNAYNNASIQQQIDPAGAWGLTQMGRGKNGPNDHGDVDWTQQLSNSVDRQHQLNNWKYWGCAKDRW